MTFIIKKEPIKSIANFPMWWGGRYFVPEPERAMEFATREAAERAAFDLASRNLNWAGRLSVTEIRVSSHDT